MNLTYKQREILTVQGHMLVTGGPGSGKTTVAILKAAEMARRGLLPGQKILFLSFARATVSRVVEAMEYEQKIPSDLRALIEVDTYHSFFWRVLKTHGYLIGLPRTMTILAPPNLAIALAAIRGEYDRKLTDDQRTEKKLREQAEMLRLATEEGRISFDLFANYAAGVLSGSQRIRQLFAARYPLIILDEFQDTNQGQWRVVQELGKEIVLHALADPEQRIFGWIGADPRRLHQFVATFSPTLVDLSDDNHRSAGTEIALFGNDVLKGTFRKQHYLGIECIAYPPYQPRAYALLVTETYKARARLVGSGKRNWSIAILVPTKKLAQSVSDTFREPPAGMTQIYHEASVDMEAAILAAHVIGFLMQPSTDGPHLSGFIDLMCDYFQGKGGDEIAKGHLDTSKKIRNGYAEYVSRQAVGKNIRANSILVNLLSVYKTARSKALIGDPDKDWISIGNVLREGACERLREIALEVRNVRLLERGTVLRTELSQDWRDNNGCYKNALEIIRRAFLQEHFSSSSKPEIGIVIMNMHKAKGKQFDEVIIFEGWPIRAKNKEIVANPDRIVRSNLRSNIDEEARQNFRVAITRAKQKTLILMPEGDTCVIFRA